MYPEAHSVVPRQDASVRPNDLLPVVAPLPADAVLLHIGVHKTGTTAIQAAFADARTVLRSMGVTYPGKLQAQHRAALVALGRRWGWNDRGGVSFPRAEYDDIVEQARSARGRVVVSSEFWCEADESTARRVVADFGGPRVHIVLTLRNLADLLPSSYQQYLKYGLERDYDEWLSDILTGPGLASPTFWRRHDHGAVVQRWVEAVSPDRVSVIVLEEVDRSAVFRTFAQLVGINEDVLVSRMDLTSNRSMTAAEAELLLGVNREVRQRLTWPEYSQYVRRGVALGIVEGREPAADEPRLRTPQWALDAAAEASARNVAAIESSGVRVIGDVALLGRRATAIPESSASEILLPTRAAVLAVIATLDASLAESRKPVPARELLRQLLRRGRAKAARLVRVGLRRRPA